MKKSIQFYGLWLAFVLLVSACTPVKTNGTTPIPSRLPAPVASATLPAILPVPNATLPPAPTQTPASATATATATQAMAGLTIEVLKNAEYRLPDSSRTIKLAGGSYQGGTGTDYLSVRLLDPVALGDLDGDGVADAVVLMAINTGGSGTFVWAVVMIAAQELPWQLATVLIGDRPKITGLTMQPDRKIILTGAIHGPGDGLCCPSLQVSETYQLTKRGLELVRLTSLTPDGNERAITIVSPVGITPVSGRFEVKGSVTIAPFENNLAYRISDGTGKQWAEGPIQVNSTQMGGQGTFEAAIDISKIPPGPIIRLEILDISPADGSMLAMDSVELLVK